MQRSTAGGILLCCFFFSAPGWALPRIVSLKPNLTEILFILGQARNVVGDVVQTKYPPAAASIAKVGGYATPDIEKIIALRPTLVMTLQEASTPKMLEPLTRAGIKVEVYKTDSLADLYRTIALMGRAVGEVKTAQALVLSLQHDIERISRQSKTQDVFRRPKVVILVQKRPFIVASGKTFLGELVQLGGGDNPFAKSRLLYPTVGMELIAEAQPDIILDFSMEMGQGKKRKGEDPFWRDFNMLPAVENHRVYSLFLEDFLAGPRLPEALQQLEGLIHGPHR